MDINTIFQAIGSIGFPIVMCVILVYYMQTEMKELKEAVNELRNAITALTTKLEDEQKGR